MTIRGLSIVTILALGTSVGLLRADASEPCCGITAIDAKTQTVTARETIIGRTFQFRVAAASPYTSLFRSQAVHADFTTMKVSLSPDGGAPCCALVNLRAPAINPVR